MQTFQKPLTKKEEEFYLERLQEEDEKQKNEAKQILIERNLRLVAHIAKKYQGTEVEMEDLISIGTIGLIKAILSYNKDKQDVLRMKSSCISEPGKNVPEKSPFTNPSVRTKKEMKLIFWILLKRNR